MLSYSKWDPDRAVLVAACCGGRLVVSISNSSAGLVTRIGRSPVVTQFIAEEMKHASALDADTSVRSERTNWVTFIDESSNTAPLRSVLVAVNFVSSACEKSTPRAVHASQSTVFSRVPTAAWVKSAP